MRLALVCCLLLALVAGPAVAADWSMVPSRSRLEFIATYERNMAPGVFREFDTRMRFDPNRLGDSSIDVTIKITSADMRSADINKAIGEPDWFDVAHFPQAEFHATRVRSAGPNRYVASGTLRLKGIEQPVEFPFAWTSAGDDATMEGELTVERARFKIGVGEWTSTSVIGADVTVKFSVALRRSA